MKNAWAGLLAFSFILLTGLSYAADKITLACSGTRLENSTELPISSAFLTIDQDHGIVTLLDANHKPGPPFPITGSTEGSIRFKAVENNGEVVAEGVIDRYSGSATITAGHDEKMISYNLTCKPAKPLF